MRYKAHVTIEFIYLPLFPEFTPTDEVKSLLGQMDEVNYHDIIYDVVSVEPATEVRKMDMHN